MKRIFKLLIPAIFLFFIMACKDEAKELDAAASTEPTERVDESAIKVNPAHGVPGHRCDLPVGAPLTASTGSTPNPVSQLPSTSVSPVRIDQTPKVNPPHGQPGHDCTVPVGAKLE